MDQKEFELYFKEILEEIEKEYAKTDHYEKVIEDEIKKFTEYVSSKGGQHYLIQHIQNAISLRSQKQSLIKDKFAVKKAILDYSIKTTVDDASSTNIFAEIAKLIEKEKQEDKQPETKKSAPENVDSKIDEILENSKDED